MSNSLLALLSGNKRQSALCTMLRSSGAPLSGNKRQSTLSTMLRGSGVLLQVILWELMTNKEPWGDMTPMQVSWHSGKASIFAAVAVLACTLLSYKTLYAAGCVSKGDRSPYSACVLAWPPRRPVWHTLRPCAEQALRTYAEDEPVWRLQVVGAVGWANKQLPITDDMQPAVLRNLIVQCFKEPQKRPSFSDIIGILKPLLDVKHLHPTPPLPATAEAAPAAAGAQAPTGATPARMQDPQQQASVAPAASPFGGKEQQDWVPASGHPQQQPGAGAAQAASPAQGVVPAAAASPFGGQEQQDWVPPGSAQGRQMPGFQPSPAPASPFGSREQQEQEGPRASPASLTGDSQQQQRPPTASASPFAGGVQQETITDQAAAAQQTPVRQWAASPFADEAQQDRLPPSGLQQGGAATAYLLPQPTHLLLPFCLASA